MTTDQGTAIRSAITPALTDRESLAAIALVCSVPLALVLAYLLPAAVRRSLVFDYGAPTVPTAFASAFVHLDVRHLLVNVGLYVLVAPLTLVLSVASGSASVPRPNLPLRSFCPV